MSTNCDAARLETAKARSANRRKSKRFTRPSKWRPRVELLEDRTLPAPVVLQGVPQWNELGPRPIIDGAPSVPPLATGAVESIAINPHNSSQIYVGTVNGGVWRTDL